MKADNLFANLPETLKDERFDDLLVSPNVRIERIVSKGHCSPQTGWYDQDENEWVMVVQGHAKIAFDDGSEIELTAGMHIDIKAHVKHKVSWTTPDEPTIWLAVFY